MILAVDCGSTNLKAALFDAGLRRLSTSSIPLPYSTRGSERVEIEPGEAWARFRQLLRSILPFSAVRTLAITSQAQTFTVLDPAGTPRLPLLSWMDSRASREAEEIQSLLGERFHRHCSFPRPLPQLEVCKLLWVRRHTNALCPGARVASLGQLLTLRLAGFGGRDRNHAAMGGLYSLAEGTWWAEALQACDVEPSQLGQLLDVGMKRPIEPAERLPPLAPTVDLVHAGNDQTAGAFGALRRSPGTLITLGTALVVYRVVGNSPGPYHAGSCWGPYPGGGFYELATRDHGGVALDWASRTLFPGGSVQDLDRAALRASPGRALFYPWRMASSHAWIGTDDRNARARAALEGMAFAARLIVEQDMEIQPDKIAGAVSVGGGGSSSDLWMQVLADVLGRECRQARFDALLGAALIASPGSDPPARDDQTFRAFVPSGDTDRYQEIYARWRRSTV